MIYFVLGSQPDLSLAEISAVLKVDLSKIQGSNLVILLDVPSQNINLLQDRLAGVIKIGHVIGEIKEWDEIAVADLIAGYASGAMGKNKINFGISVYDMGNRKATKDIEREIDSLGGQVKRILKESGRPVRYVTSKEPQLSSAVIETNGLLMSGGEYVLLVGKDSIQIGQTETVQDFRAWSDRDYGRPARDKHSGMLPPKLARMMINLSGIHPQGRSILDPFCGSGTVLMEAQLMGFEKLIGSDISEKAVQDTQTNTNWTTERFDLPVPDITLLTTPTQEITKHISELVDVIVTEVFLGKPRTCAVDLHQARRIEKELMPMFEESFAQLKTLFKNTTVAVVAFPSFKLKNNDWYRLPISQMLEKLGYTTKENLLYFRPDQFVARDIYIFSL